MKVANESWEGSANFHCSKNLKDRGYTFFRQALGIKPFTPVLKRLGPGRVGPCTIPEFLDVYNSTQSGISAIFWYWAEPKNNNISLDQTGTGSRTQTLLGNLHLYKMHRPLESYATRFHGLSFIRINFVVWRGVVPRSAVKSNERGEGTVKQAAESKPYIQWLGKSLAPHKIILYPLQLPGNGYHIYMIIY